MHVKSSVTVKKFNIIKQKAGALHHDKREGVLKARSHPQKVFSCVNAA